MKTNQSKPKNETPSLEGRDEASLLKDDIGKHFTSKRITSSLRKSGIHTMGDLIDKGDLNVVCLPGIGVKSGRKIISVLDEIGLKLAVVRPRTVDGRVIMVRMEAFA